MMALQRALRTPIYKKEKKKKKNTSNNKNIDAVRVWKNGNLIGIVYSKLLVRLCGLVNS